MKALNVISIFVIFLSFVSCNDKDNFEEPQIEGLLKSVLIGGEVYQEFTYNKAALIEEEKSKFHYSKYLYSNMNRLAKSEHYWDESIASSNSYVLEDALKRTEWVSPENTDLDVYTTYEYDRSGELQKTITNRLQNDIVSTSNYKCNDNGQIETKTWKNDFGPESFDRYYYDSVGNLIKEVRFYGNELQTTTEYEFDNKHNPYFPFRKLMIPGQNTNPNNIVKETYTLHFEVDKFIDKVQIKEYSYEYNSNGYPVKRSDGFEYVYN